MTSSDAALTDLLSEARDWAAQDPDPATAAALTELIRLSEDGAAGARQELADSFSGTLQFGTAGLDRKSLIIIFLPARAKRG